MWLFILIVLSVAILCDIVFYNSLVFLRQKVQEAKSGIDVQLKRRHDLIPQLVATVKEYTLHEQDLLTRLAQERVSYNDVKKVFALAESYPDLKSNKNFEKLQEEISETEDHIAASRAIYNQNANIFNTKIQSFPEFLVAKLHGFVQIDLFEMK